MHYAVTKTPDGVVTLMVRAEGDGGMVGDLVCDLHPGDTALGKTYEEWAAEAVLIAPRGQDRTVYVTHPKPKAAPGEEFTVGRPLVASTKQDVPAPVLAITVPDGLVDCERAGNVMLPRGLRLKVTADGEATATKPKKRKR